MEHRESVKAKQPEDAGLSIPCCPPLEPDQVCDVHHWHYRLIHNTTVDQRQVSVEVIIQARLERCPGPLSLGDLVYSTTLLPGEKVHLFTMDRRSRFSFDSATKVSYRHVQSSEERYYMSSMSDFMSDLTVRDESRAVNRRHGSVDTHGKTSGVLESIFGGPSVEVGGSYNAESTNEFMSELTQHARASHRRSELAVRSANSTSIGEVSTRTHAEGESEDHFESSSRTFSNPNRCHAVTFLFYQINKAQTVRFTIDSIRRRVIDPAADTKVTNNPFLAQGEVSAIPNAVLATDTERLNVEKVGRDSVAAQVGDAVSPYSLNRARGVSTAGQPTLVLAQPFQRVEPLPKEVREQALRQVDEGLVAVGLLNEPGGQISDKAKTEFSLEIQSSLPTPGVIVKGCLDDCDICEPTLMDEIEQEIRRKKLENDLLKSQIDLLPQSQEYRCCPPGSVEETDEDDDK